jgi:hypothetical protein
MGRFPDWKRPLTVALEESRSRRSEVGRFATDLAALGRETTSDASDAAAELLDRARSRVVQIPGMLAGELRRRLNLLDLATRDDVTVQSRLGRNRMSFVLREFLDTQRTRDAELRAAIRDEVRRELHRTPIGTAGRATMTAVGLDTNRPRAGAEEQVDLRRVPDVDLLDDELEVFEREVPMGTMLDDPADPLDPLDPLDADA